MLVVKEVLQVPQDHLRFVALLLDRERESIAVGVREPEDALPLGAGVLEVVPRRGEADHALMDAVIRAFERYHRVPPRHPLRDAHRCLDGVPTCNSHEDLRVPSKTPGEDGMHRLEAGNSRLGGEFKRVPYLPQLPLHRLGHLRVLVAEGHDADPAHPIDVQVAI